MSAAGSNLPPMEAAVAGGSFGGSFGGVAGGSFGGSFGGNVGNSLYSHEALLRSRAALANPADTTAYGTPVWTDFIAPSTPPAESCAERLARWDGWVIPYIVLPGLLAGLRVQAAPDRSSCSLLVGTQATRTLRIDRPSAELFKAQLADVIADAELREDRAPEILMQTQNANAFFATVLPMTDARTPATLRLLNIANQVALFVEMQMKHIFACARPVEYSPQVQPMIITPGHGTYPMGHGCEARVTARLLAALTLPVGGANPTWSSLKHQLDRLAERIAENRIVSGVHFKVDQGAGDALGEALADYLEAFAHDATHPNVELRVFNPAQPAADVGAEAALPNVAITLPPAIDRCELLHIWAQARQEWRWLNNEPLPQP